MIFFFFWEAVSIEGGITGKLNGSIGYKHFSLARRPSIIVKGCYTKDLQVTYVGLKAGDVGLYPGEVGPPGDVGEPEKFGEVGE
jgi:hypothetical protein